MGNVYIYNAGGLVSEHAAPQQDAGQVRDLLLALNKPSNIAIIVGEGSGQSPQAVAGLLQKGWVVVQWTGFPFFYDTGSYPLSLNYGRMTGTSPFSTVIDQWAQKPLPPPESAFKLGSYLANGPWDFNPLDFKFGQDVRDIYHYTRAFITRSTQSNTGIPFHSAPTSSAFPNFNFPYNGIHYYGYSGIMAVCNGNGLYFWCASQVPAYNVAEFVAQSAFGTPITSPGHKTSPSTSSHYTSPSNNSQSYTVQKGDTLSGIAQKICGNANDWPYIAQVNNLHSPYTIYPGQKLIVRCAASPTTHPSTSPPSTSTYTPPSTSTTTPPSTSVPSTSTGFLGLTPTEERDALIVLAAGLGIYLIAKDL